MKWAEPPASKNRWAGPAWEEEAGELRGNPGEWAVVKTFPAISKTVSDKARTLAYAIRSGKHLVWRPAGSFEAVSRQVTGDDGSEVINVYARYIGEPDA